MNIGGFKFTTDEQSLAVNMTKYWTNFAHTGNPNDFYGEDRIPDWDVYYVDKDTGTSKAACMRFKTPRSEVGMCVCGCEIVLSGSVCCI